MLTLDDTTTKLQLTTSSTSAVDVSVSYEDERNDGTRRVSGSQETAITTATTTDILAVPALSNRRVVRLISALNKGGSSNTVTIIKDVNGTDYQICAVALAAGERLEIRDGQLAVFESTGTLKVTGGSSSSGVSAYTGYPAFFFKNGTAPEAAGNYYCFAKDSGNPGAWAVGTPGVNGRTTDGTAAADAGCVLFRNAATGGIYLTDWKVQSSRVAPVFLIDIVWVNSGLVVGTGAQAIVSGAMPARDVDGAVTGAGYGIGILVTGTLGNAAAVATSTCSYTNTAGTAGRTATLTAQTGYQVPATAVVGTFIQMRLQAGDTGVQSIQSWNTGTTYTSGTYSLVVYRMIDQDAVLVANLGTPTKDIYTPGIRLYSGSCLFPMVIADGATAYNIAGTIVMMER
jgi:hypothetical protein